MLAWPAFAQTAGPAEDPQYRRGLALLEADQPDYEEAYREFKRAYEQSRDWRVLASLAHAAEALERDGEAIQAYAEYLARGGDGIDPDDRSAVERALRVLQGNVGRVTITSSVPDLTIVASRVGSEAPPQVYRLERGRIELELRSGTHLLTGTAGGDRLEWQVVLTPGSAVEHRFEFAGSQSPAEPLEGEEASPSGVSTLRIASIAAASVGSAALVAGAVTGLLVLARDDDARALCRKGPRGGTECPERSRDDFEAARRYATTTNVLLIGGGLLAALGVGTFVISGADAERDRSAVRVSPALSSKQATLTVAGAF